MSERLEHPFGPLYDASSRILILGSFPSVKSREQNFFYGHPQNRFWRVMSGLLGEPFPKTTAEKREMILRHHIALWDTVASCTVTGSSDASIRDVVPNDLSRIFDAADIRTVYCNGGTSWALYEKYIRPLSGREAVKLPSTSPANAAWSPERLAAAWSVILKDLEQTEDALVLCRPEKEDLRFRQQLLADPATMSYNAAWGGTIPFPEERWADWYGVWMEDPAGRHFYRYLQEKKTGGFVGETAYHFDEERKIWLADVIVAAAQRGKGYGRQGLRLLCGAAAENGIDVLRDDIAAGNPAISLFLQEGFAEEYRTDEIIMLKKVLKT